MPLSPIRVGSTHKVRIPLNNLALPRETWYPVRIRIVMKHFNVAAAVFIENNKVFCAQRKDSGETAKLWEFPGGKIEEGETPDEALVREIQEELCVNIRVEDFITIVNHEYKTFSITMHAYLCTILSGKLTLTEHLDSRWLSVEELESVDWAPADVPIVEKVRVRMRGLNVC